MKTKIKKLTAVILAIITILSMFTVMSSAATTNAFKKISSQKIAKVFALDGDENIIPYTNKKLTTRGTETYGASKKAYISPDDEIYIYKIDTTNGVWAYVSYPVGSKRVFAYIRLSDITTVSTKHTITESSGKFYCSIRPDSTKSSSYFVDTGDTVFELAKNKSGTKIQILYPTSSNGYRIAWCDYKDYKKYCLDKPTQNSDNSSTTSTTFQYPMKKYKISNDWSNNVSFKPSNRNDHIAIDFIPNGDNNIYAAGAGKVVKVGYNNANGYYVIIEHNIDGSTIYSFYAHLKSYCVSVGEKVKKGEKIAIVGATGSSSNRAIHLHFAFVNQIWSGSYYGYSSKISGNKKTYSGVTYYNPNYIIKNGKLPA